jgi:hypothetical protein
VGVREVVILPHDNTKVWEVTGKCGNWGLWYGIRMLLAAVVSAILGLLWAPWVCFVMKAAAFVVAGAA